MSTNSAPRADRESPHAHSPKTTMRPTRARRRSERRSARMALPLLKFSMVMASERERALGREDLDAAPDVAMDVFSFELYRQVVRDGHSEADNSRPRAAARDEQNVLREERVVGRGLRRKLGPFAAHVRQESPDLLAQLEERSLRGPRPTPGPV